MRQNASGIGFDCLVEEDEREAGRVVDLERVACVGLSSFAGGCDLCPRAGGMEERRATLLLGGIARMPWGSSISSSGSVPPEWYVEGPIRAVAGVVFERSVVSRRGRERGK